MVETQEKPDFELNQDVIYSAPEGQDARILAERARSLMPKDRVLVHIALDDARVATLKELLDFFAPDVKIIEFPAWDCLPYDRVSPNAEIVARRVSALTQMLLWEKEAKRYPRLILTTVNAITQRVMPRSALAGASFTAAKGGRLDVEGMQAFLTQNGYSRTETVREAGEYAMRGGIIDLFPPGYEEPVRLDLFGDEIESIRSFDPLTQRTSKDAGSFSLQPVTEFFLDDASIDRFRGGYREAFGVVSNDPLYEAVSEGRRYNGVEHWLPLFYESMDTLLDYAPAHELIIDHHGRRAHDERFAQIKDFYQSRKTLEQAGSKKGKKSKDVSLSGSTYHPLPLERLYIEDMEWNEIIAHAFLISPFGEPGQEELEVKKARDFADIRALPRW